VRAAFSPDLRNPGDGFISPELTALILYAVPMDTLRPADPAIQSRITRLDECLLLLNAGSDRSATVAEPVVSSRPSRRFSSWTNQFEANRDQITRRLALIETELDRLDTPGLGVFG